MSVDKTLSDVKKAGHSNIVVLGVGNNSNPDAMSFYTSHTDFNWVLTQLSRGQLNLLMAQSQEMKEIEEVEKEAAKV
jgi:hypothetical protein